MNNCYCYNLAPMKTLISTYEDMLRQFELRNYVRVIPKADKLLRGFEEKFHLKAYTLKGYSHLYEGQGVEALAAFRAGVERYPDDTELQFGLGTTLNEVQHFAEAVTVLQPLLEKFPEDEELLGVLLDPLIALDRNEEVVKYCGQALSLAPDDYTLMIVMAQSHLELGNYEEAISFHESALAEEDLTELSLAIIHNSLGQTYLQKGDLPAAKRHFEKSLYNDKEANTYTHLGLTMALMGDLKEGLDMVNYALGLDAYAPEAYLNRAKIRLLQQKPNKAKRDYETAVRLGISQKEANEVRRKLDRYGN